MKIGLDVDDVLFPCTSKAIDALIKKGISVDSDTIEWDFSNLEPEARKLARDTLHKVETFVFQKPFPGAVEMVKALLQRGHEVYFVTAPYPELIQYRYSQLRRFFPEVPERNIIIAGDKSIIALDVLLDDGPHNLEASIAKHVVRWALPWNRNCQRKDMETAHSYSEFVCMVDEWDDRYPQIICLVGPSASGKTTIAEALVKTGKFIAPQSVTTRQRREGEPEDAYQFIDLQVFHDLVAKNGLVESTCYNGNYYGLTYQEIDRCLQSGKTIVVPVDINGAAALKKNYKGVISVFVSRPLNNILNSLQERKLPDDVLLSRISSMKEEMENSSRCDVCIDNSRTVADSAQQVKAIADSKLIDLLASNAGLGINQVVTA